MSSMGEEKKLHMRLLRMLDTTGKEAEKPRIDLGKLTHALPFQALSVSRLE